MKVWLIESRLGGRACWWLPESPKFNGFTAEADKAVHFARDADAKAVLEHLPSKESFKVVEKEFILS